MPTVCTAAEENPCISRPTKRTHVVLPIEKARVETARATRPQRYGPRQELVRSANRPAIADDAGSEEYACRASCFGVQVGEAWERYITYVILP